MSVIELKATLNHAYTPHSLRHRVHRKKQTLRPEVLWSLASVAQGSAGMRTTTGHGTHQAFLLLTCSAFIFTPGGPLTWEAPPHLEALTWRLPSLDAPHLEALT